MALPVPGVRNIIDLPKNGLSVAAQEKIMVLRLAALELQEENLLLRDKVHEL